MALLEELQFVVADLYRGIPPVGARVLQPAVERHHGRRRQELRAPALREESVQSRSRLEVEDERFRVRGLGLGFWVLGFGV